MYTHDFEPTYTRPSQRLAVIVGDAIPLPEFFVQQGAAHVIMMQPRGWGGDHTHERQEAFVGFGSELYMVWRDDQGLRREMSMSAAPGMLRLFVVPSGVAHMIENRSATMPAVIYELVDRDDGPALALLPGESLRKE